MKEEHDRYSISEYTRSDDSPIKRDRCTSTTDLTMFTTKRSNSFSEGFTPKLFNTKYEAEQILSPPSYRGKEVRNIGCFNRWNRSSSEPPHPPNAPKQLTKTEWRSWDSLPISNGPDSIRSKQLVYNKTFDGNKFDNSRNIRGNIFSSIGPDIAFCRDCNIFVYLSKGISR